MPTNAPIAPYATPVLTRLGAVVALTLSNSTGSRMDGGGSCGSSMRQTMTGTFC